MYKIKRPAYQVIRSPMSIKRYANQFKKLQFLFCGAGVYSKMVAFKNMKQDSVVFLSSTVEESQQLLDKNVFDVLIIEDLFYIKLRQKIKHYIKKYPEIVVAILGGKLFLERLTTSYSYDVVLNKYDNVSKLIRDLDGVLKQKLRIKNETFYGDIPPV